MEIRAWGLRGRAILLFAVTGIGRQSQKNGHKSDRQGRRRQNSSPAFARWHKSYLVRLFRQLFRCTEITGNLRSSAITKKRRGWRLPASKEEKYEGYESKVGRSERQSHW